MNDKYHRLDSDLIKNALESDSEITLGTSNLVISSNISSERDFEQAIDDVENHIEKEETNDIIFTYTRDSEQESDSKIFTESVQLNESVIIDNEIKIDKSVLYNVEHLFPEEESYRHCNYLVKAIQTLVKLENKIDTDNINSYYDIQYLLNSIQFVEKSYHIKLPIEVTTIATYSSKLYLGTCNGEIISTPLDCFQPPQNFNEKLYTPSSTSAAVTCLCISRDSKWILSGHQNGIIQLLQLYTVDKQEQGLIQGLNFMRISNESQKKKPGSEYLNSIANVSIPKTPLNIECLNKTNWDLFVSICKGFNTNEYSLFIFSISTTVLSYKLTILDSLPFHNLSLTHHPGMVSTEIDLEISTPNENKKTGNNANDEKRQKNTFNFSLFQPGLVHMMSYSKNKSVSLVSTINIDRGIKPDDFDKNSLNIGNFDGETRGVWLRSSSTFQSILFVIDLLTIHLISPNGSIITYDTVTDFKIPYEIVNLKRLSLSIVVALDIKGTFHFFQLLGHKDNLTIVKFGENDNCMLDIPEITSNSGIPRVCCSISEINIEEKGCKKFVATVNSISNIPNINRKTIPIDSFPCKFGQICVFSSGKLHLFIISSWFNLLCKLAFNKKFSRLLRILSFLYQNKMPRLLEFQSNRYQSDAQKLLLYTLHQSCAQAVKMKQELGINELFLSDKRIEPLKTLCCILIESCMNTNMYNELVGLLFRSFNGIYLANLFISQFLDIVLKKYKIHSNELNQITPYFLGSTLTESIITLLRNALNEVNINEILQPNVYFTNGINTTFLNQTPTDSMLRCHLILKLLDNISNLAINNMKIPILLESEPFQNLAIEFELWDILVKLKMNDLTSDLLVYLFDTLSLQLVKLRESTFEKHYKSTFNKLKKLLLPLIPPVTLYNNNCLANTFSSLWTITDYTLNSCDSSHGYFTNPSYREIFIESLHNILSMSYGSENITNQIKYVENAILHPILTESILLNPQSWFEYSKRNDRYHPVLRSHYNSYNLDNDKLDPEVVAYKVLYYENAFKLYSLSFMIYHVLENFDPSFNRWDDLLYIFQSEIIIHNNQIRENLIDYNLTEHTKFRECSHHKMEIISLDNIDNDTENVLFSAKNNETFESFFLDKNFDIIYSCNCYYGYLCSLLGLLVKRLIPFDTVPNELYTLSQLPLDLSIEDKCILYEALSMFDEIFKLLDKNNLSRFLSNNFNFIEIDENDEIVITIPKSINYLLTLSVLNNITKLRELDIKIVRRVLFYTLSNESIKLMVNMGVLTDISEMANKLLDSLYDYPELQADVYILLTRNFKDKLIEFDRFDHLFELLCKQKCKRLISLLKREPKIDINKCLSIVNDKYPFPIVKSYLLERAGNIHSALDSIDDFDERVDITIRSIGKIKNHSLLSKWIDLIDENIDNLLKVTKCLIKLSKYGLDISEYPDLIEKFIKRVETFDTLENDINSSIIDLFKNILRSLDMKKEIFIETLQLSRQSLDIQVAKKMKSLSKGILVGKNNNFDKNLPFSNICGSCNKPINIDDEMRIFLCGHVFHSLCKPEMACNMH